MLFYQMHTYKNNNVIQYDVVPTVKTKIWKRLDSKPTIRHLHWLLGQSCWEESKDRCTNSLLAKSEYSVRVRIREKLITVVRRWGRGGGWEAAIIIPIKSDTKIDIKCVVANEDWFTCALFWYTRNGIGHIRSNRVSAESGRFPKKHAASMFPRCGRTTFSIVQNAFGCTARRRRPVDTPLSYSG